MQRATCNVQRIRGGSPQLSTLEFLFLTCQQPPGSFRVNRLFIVLVKSGKKQKSHGVYPFYPFFFVSFFLMPCSIYIHRWKKLRNDSALLNFQLARSLIIEPKVVGFLFLCHATRKAYGDYIYFFFCYTIPGTCECTRVYFYL